MIQTILNWFCGRGRGISLLVPFHCPDKKSQRYKNWKWLKRYWRAQLPWAQIVMGHDRFAEEDPCLPFSKAVAVNDAASKAKGDIFVIIDADGYIPADSILHCARKIRLTERAGHRLWFIPYRHFYRLTPQGSQLVLDSDPEKPYKFSSPPPLEYIQNCSGSHLGHWFGALIQVCSRFAFELVGGWDPRFRGWGGEDHAAMRAMDTLYWHHKTLPQQVLHLWHPMRSLKGTSTWVDWNERIWDNQETDGNNDELSRKYYGANGDETRMRKLVDEGRMNAGE
jgi:glycosyltransferase involved in cell wall biosynthesis